jgi:organic radical activating enzyme
LNTQEPEKEIVNEATLDVVKVWMTMQGEGPYAGTPACFVRLAGCNLQCPLCDTDYTSNRKHGFVGDVGDLIMNTIGDSTTLIVITGGEPFRQPALGPLVNRLLRQSPSYIRVQIESNCTVFQPGLNYEHVSTRHSPGTGRLSIVCSPKTPKIDNKFYALIGAYKYIVRAGEIGDDGLPNVGPLGLTSGAPARPLNPMTMPEDIFLQPCDEPGDLASETNLRECVASCMSHGYRLSLQTHKIIGME